jgi:hypothetical protein
MSTFRYNGAAWSLVIDTGLDVSIPTGLSIAPDTSLAVEVEDDGWYQSVDDGVTWSAWSNSWVADLLYAYGCHVISYEYIPREELGRTALSPL